MPPNSSTVADKLVVDRAVWEGAKALAPAMARRKAQADFMVTILSVIADTNDEDAGARCMQKTCWPR